MTIRPTCKRGPNRRSPHRALALALLLSGCVHYEPRELRPGQEAAALQSRSLDSAEVVAFVRANLPEGKRDAVPGVWDLESLTLAAFHYHPTLEVARAQWAVARGGVKTAKARPNPVLGVTPGYNLSTTGAASPWFPAVTLDVPVETAGKRGFRRTQADQLALAARLNLVEAAWQIRAGVRAALVETIHAEARVRALTEQAELEAKMAELARQRLAAGATGMLETSQHRAAADRARLDAAEGMRAAVMARAKLAEALAIPSSALAGIKLDFSLGDMPEGVEDLSAPTLRDTALRGRADVLAALAEFEAGSAALRLEIARQYPDLHLGNGYQYDQGDHKWSLGVTLELPLLNRNEGPIAVAAARREEAAARFNAVQARVLAQIDQAVANRAAAQAGLEQARSLLSTQEEAARAAEQAFRAGGLDALEAQTAALELNSVRLAALDAQRQFQLAVGMLEDALQQPIAGLAAVDRRPGAPISSP